MLLRKLALAALLPCLLPLASARAGWRINGPPYGPYYAYYRPYYTSDPYYAPYYRPYAGLYYFSPPVYSAPTPSYAQPLPIDAPMWPNQTFNPPIPVSPSSPQPDSVVVPATPAGS
jgi:hypothetical protein